MKNKQTLLLKFQALSVEKRSSLMASLCFLVIIGIFLPMSLYIQERGIVKLETNVMQREVRIAIGTIENEISSLDRILNDWAPWNDTYQFIEDANPEYIKQNLDDAAMINLNIDVILFVNIQGKIIFVKIIDSLSGKEVPSSVDINTFLDENSVLIELTDIKSYKSGFTLFGDQVMIISSRPILTSNYQGSIRGYLIFGRYLNEQELHRISTQVLHDIAIFRTDASSNSPALQSMITQLSKLGQNAIQVYPLEADTVAGYTLLKDINGDTKLILEVSMPRETYMFGQNNKYLFMAAFLVMGIMMTIIIKIVLTRYFKSQQTSIENMQLYEAFMQQTSEAILLIDEDKRILNTNKACEILLNFKLDKTIPQTLYDIFPQNHAEIIRDLPKDNRSGSHIIGERRLTRRDGLIIHVEVNADHISYQGHKVLCMVMHDITMRKQIEEKLDHNALHDALTGLPNRTLFLDRLSHTYERNKRHSTKDSPAWAVMFMDIDRFTSINESFGHLTGDKLLIDLANRLKSCMRTMDTVARLGGDDFLVLIENINSQDDVIAIAHRIQELFKIPFRIFDHELFISCHIGMVIPQQNYEQIIDIIRDANTALYYAKESEGTEPVIFDLKMRSQAIARLDLENELRRAIERQEFRLHYQPIISLIENKIMGIEALIRWQHPKRGLLAPGQFISVAEETGLIVPIGQWVLEIACYQTALWQKNFSQDPQLIISVNISGRQFHDKNLLNSILGILKKTNLPPASLWLEITESMLMKDTTSMDTLCTLKDMGVHLKIDDFGTGYSSLSYLQKLPVDGIKIDRSFVSGMETDQSNIRIVKTIVDLADNMGFHVVAEGVETYTQMNILKEMGVNEMQGYLFSKPIEDKALDELLKSNR